MTASKAKLREITKQLDKLTDERDAMESELNKQKQEELKEALSDPIGSIKQARKSMQDLAHFLAHAQSALQAISGIPMHLRHTEDE